MPADLRLPNFPQPMNYPGTDAADMELVSEVRQQSSPFLELGSTGLKRASGYVDEEFLPQLRGRKAIQVYREMDDNDAIIGALMFAITNLVKQVEWHAVPAGKTAADAAAARLLETCMDDMSHSWSDFVQEALSALIYGWSWHEIVWKRRMGPWQRDGRHRSKYSDGLIGIRKMPIRAQETWQRWIFDTGGDVRGMVQLAPPDYKTTVLPIERSLLFRYGSYKGNPEGKSILRRAYRCLTPDHDVLTRRGWVPVAEVTEQDEVRAADGWSHPERVWNYDYAGDMIQAQSRYVSQLVTPNHRMWVKREGCDEFEFINADQCGPRVSFGADATSETPDAESIQIGSQSISVDTWAPFLGWWLAEGHSWSAKPESSNPSRREVGLTQKDGPTADTIRNVIAALPWSFYERTDARGIVHWTATKGELYDALAPLGKARTKQMPDYVFDWSARQINLLLDAYVLGDGSRCGNADYRGTDVLFTSSSQMADDLQRAGLLAGWRAQRRTLGASDSRMGGVMYAVSLGKHFPQMRATWSTVPYEGTVHCLTVPSGRFMVRRDGKASWTGNSWFYKKRFEEFEAIGVERDLAGLPMVRVPAAWLKARPGTDQYKQVQAYQKLVRSIRRNEQEGIVFPRSIDRDSKMDEFDFELITSGGARQFPTDPIIQRLETRMLMTVLMDWIIVGHQQTGTYNMHVDKTGIAKVALNAITQGMLGDTINRHLVPRLFAINGWKPAALPRWVPDDVEAPDLTQLAQFMGATAGIGFNWGPDADLERWMRSAAKMPQLGDVDYKRHQKEARDAESLRLVTQQTELLSAKSQLAQMMAQQRLQAEGLDPDMQAAGIDAGRAQEAHESQMAQGKAETKATMQQAYTTRSSTSRPQGGRPKGTPNRNGKQGTGTPKRAA